jgi:hypothetical protein
MWDDYIPKPRLYDLIKSKLINNSKYGIDFKYSFGVDKRKIFLDRRGIFLQVIRSSSTYAKNIYYVRVSAKYKLYFFDDIQIVNFDKFVYFFPIADNMICYFTSDSNIDREFGTLYNSPNENKWKTIEFEKLIDLLKNPISHA